MGGPLGDNQEEYIFKPAGNITVQEIAEILKRMKLTIYGQEVYDDMPQNVQRHFINKDIAHIPRKP